MGSQQKRAVPFAEPVSHSRDLSPYYNGSHRKLRDFVKRYVEEELAPFAQEWERIGEVPHSVRYSYIKSHFNFDFSPFC